MGYFDTLVEVNFKEGATGEIIFFPNGFMGKGRVVPNEDVKQRLCEFQRMEYKFTYLIFIPYLWILAISGFFSVVFLCPAIVAWCFILYKQHSLTKGLEEHDLKLSFREAYVKRSRAQPNWYYWMVGIVSSLLMVYGVMLAIFSHKPIIALIIFACGLLGLGVSTQGYRLKNLTNSGSKQ